MVHRIRLFAILRERARQDSIEIEVAEGATVGDALDALGAQHDALAPLIAAMPMVMAVNGDYATRETILAAGDELALIPPVSGGADAPARARVHDGPLSLDRLTRAVQTPHTGAVVCFQGTTRDVERLDYEAYLPMAEARIESILDQALADHEIEAADAEHRIGAVPLGEPSVIVAVAAAHRGPAFAAAREIIDRIKAEAPIWKREVDGERAEWAQGTPPADA
jgi:MoaE-MoaD fusion protein